MDTTEPTGTAGGLLRLFQHASRYGDWWTSDLATLVIKPTQNRPFATALAGITTALREGSDPMWVVFGTTPAAAFVVTQEWLDAELDPNEVHSWLRAGCWSPLSARRLVD